MGTSAGDLSPGATPVDIRGRAPSTGAVPADPLPRPLFCRLPFTEVNVMDDGDVYPNCCRDWVAFPLGNLFTQTWDEVWNGPQAQELRRSMVEGDLRHCDQHWCPHIQSALAGEENANVVPLSRRGRLALPPDVDGGALTTQHGPVHVSMHYDWSCNLACPTCRDEVRTVQGEEAERMAQLHRIVEDELLVGARSIGMTGTGDPFASRFLRDFLISFRPERLPSVRHVALYTNAQMLTPQMWARMPGLHDIAVSIDISIDAATAATYEVVRAPGRWDRLMANLDFIATIPNLDELCLNMTISRLNAGEVLAFHDLVTEVAGRTPERKTALEYKRVRRWDQTDDEWERLDLARLSPGERDDLVRQLRAVEQRHGGWSRWRRLRRRLRSGPSNVPLVVRSNLADLVDGPVAGRLGASQ